MFDPGDLLRISVTFTDLSGTPTDPTTIALELRLPFAAPSTYTYAAAQIARDGVGLYHYDLNATTSGTYAWEWQTTGAVQTTEPGSLYVRPDVTGSILSPADFDEVRAALSPDLDSTDLPDSVIARDVYQGAAEREILALDSGALGRTGLEGRHVRTAAIFLTAARLALRLTRVSSERIASWSASYLNQDPPELAASLRAQAMEELGAITGVLKDLTSSVRPIAMMLAPGGRGDVRPRPSWWTDPSFW